MSILKTSHNHRQGNVVHGGEEVGIAKCFGPGILLSTRGAFI